MAKAGGEAVSNLKNGMLYHDIELEATKVMLEDASKSIGIFSLRQSDEYNQYADDGLEDVDKIVKRVIEIVQNK